MKIKALASAKNVELAWRRITTGTNHQYKRFFRDLYYAYEISIPANLKDLRQRILNGAWEPNTPDRFYMPKPSGLQRPLSLLYLEDQIVLQALANLISQQIYTKRRPYLLKQVFSNVLARRNSIFFFRDWHGTYTAFQKKIREHYDAGLRWVADFDLAAFYDTISHDLLLHTAYPRLRETDDVVWIEKCLKTWSASKISSARGHGLPQGPIASDFLAESFLLPIDRAMADVKGYVRYVDDVRLLASSEDDVRRLLLKLEILCRERGLIPQTGKFAIRRASSVTEASSMLPSINEPGGDSPTPQIGSRRGLRLLKSGVGGRPLKVLDKTRIRYALYRSQPSPRLLKLVRLLLPRHPEHIDAFTAYLSQYSYRKSIADLCIGVIASSPYEYVKGELWHILARNYQDPRAFSRLKRLQLVQDAIHVLKSPDASIYLKWGTGHFLCVAEDCDGILYTKFLNFQKSAILQALLAPFLPESAFTSAGPARYFLVRSSFEPAVALAESLHRLKKKPSDLGVAVNALPNQARNVYHKLGIDNSPPPRLDVIGEVIKRRYNVRSVGQWKRLLGGEYAYAAALLAQADAVYFSGPSRWLGMQNSFNQTVFLGLQQHLQAVGDTGVVNVRNKKGELIAFGVNLQRGNAFSKRHAIIADGFREANNRRNRLPTSHPYEMKSMARNSYLRPQERNRLLNRLAKSYEAIVKLVP